MILVVDYGIGNLRSAEKAFAASGSPAALCDQPEQLADASGIVLPGVGAFGRCAEALDRGAWRQPLIDAITNGTPFLGICVGFQLLYDSSEESPGARGLGILPGEVRRLPGDVKLPQIQWNRLDGVRPRSLVDHEGDQWMYFVHSFAAPPSDAVTSMCDYGGPVVASVERDNVCGVQFHPEKSGRQGLAMLARFALRAEER